MLHDKPGTFRPAARQPQQSLRLQSESMLAPSGPFYGPGTAAPARKAPDLMRLKRELYDVRGVGGAGIGFAYDDVR